MNVNTIAQTNRRNYGIDLLRLHSMFLVTILHVLGHGGVLNASQGINNSLAWLLEISAYCAVDCFAIISGFVCYSDEEKTYRYRKFISFWLQVFVYSFGIALAAYIIKPQSMSLKDVLKFAIPVATKKYWYVSAYAGLFFVIPWLNKLVRTCSKREYIIVLSLIVLFSIQSLIYDPYSLMYGYSFVWLVILYILGAFLKKYNIPHLIKNKTWIIILVSCILLTWVWKNSSPILPDIFVNYISPTTLLVAISYVCIFSNFHFGENATRIIHILSPAAFGVYLIHEQEIVRDNLISQSFIWIASSTPLLLAFQVLGCAFGIFAVCLLIEIIRRYIFKIVHVDAMIDRISDAFLIWINLFLNKHNII